MNHIPFCSPDYFVDNPKVEVRASFKIYVLDCIKASIGERLVPLPVPVVQQDKFESIQQLQAVPAFPAEGFLHLLAYFIETERLSFSNTVLCVNIPKKDGKNERVIVYANRNDTVTHLFAFKQGIARVLDADFVFHPLVHKSVCGT